MQPTPPDRSHLLTADEARIRLGIGRTTFNRLVHDGALQVVMLRGSGVPVKVVSERPGHADPGFTMRTYQDVLRAMQRQAADGFASALWV